MHPRQKEIIWGSDIAYAVGLITTDGCLSPDGRHFDFTSNDYDLIETFKRCLGIKNKIVKKRSGYTNVLSGFRVQFGNVTFHKWLCEKVGLMPNKSKQLKELHIPDVYFFDFLRGHLDGDGCIKRYNDPHYPSSIRLYVEFTSASFPHLEWIRDTIERIVGIQGFFRKRLLINSLTYSKHNSIVLLNQLYHRSNTPCLKRKYNIAKEFLIMPR